MHRINKKKYVKSLFLRVLRLPARWISILIIPLFCSATSFVNDFLLVDNDVRAKALGGCISSSRGVSALFGNPSRIGYSNEIAFLSHEQLYQGLVSSDALGIRFPVPDGYAAIGLSYIGGSGIIITDIPDPDSPVSENNRPYKIDEEGHHDVALTTGYSRYFSDKISAGIALSGFYRDHANSIAKGASVTLGGDYSYNDNLSLTVNLNNLGFSSWETGTNEIAFLSLGIGGIYNYSLGSNFGGIICFDGRYFPNEKVTEGYAGGEIVYSDLFALRAGIDNGQFTAGAGLSIIPNIDIDIALSLHEALPISYRVGLKYNPIKNIY